MVMLPAVVILIGFCCVAHLYVEQFWSTLSEICDVRCESNFVYVSDLTSHKR